jgi:hypothetical protein
MGQLDSDMNRDTNREVSAALTETESPPMDTAASWVRIISWAVTILAAAFLTFLSRFTMNVDGLSYLDVADNYVHGKWSAAINAYWSPFYSWVLAFGLRILKPSAYWEFAAVQFVNFVIFLVALWAFDMFWRAQGEHYRESARASGDPNCSTLPRWAWLTLGYAIFLWIVTSATLVSEVTPDLLVAAIVFVLATLLGRMRAGNSSFGIFGLFGFGLGFAYLGKAAMFVLAMPFLVVAFFTVGNLRRGFVRITVAFLVFLFVSGPFISLISKQKGRFTFGDSGPISYSWGVNHSGPRWNWQGGNPAHGIPLHPTRQLLSDPALFEYATPVSGTYPPHYDPSYWNAGMKPNPNFREQLIVLFTSCYAIYSQIALPQSGLIAGTLIVLVLGGSFATVIRRIGTQWHLLVPALAGFGLYSLVTVEPRYVGGFIVMFWAAMLSSIQLPRQEWVRKLCAGFAIAAALTLSLSAVEKLAVRTFEWRERSVNVRWQVAHDLEQFGVHEGDRVVCLGSAYNAYWARLGRFKIVAEIPTNDLDSFWAGGVPVLSEVVAIADRIGAKGIVASGIPKSAAQGSWLKVGDTGFYFYPVHQAN